MTERAHPEDRPLRVVKLGGSLFEFPQLMPQLRNWLSRQTPACHVLIAGGGPVVDAIRDADRLHALGEVAAHWLSIRCMSVTAGMVAALLPESILVTAIDELRAKRGIAGVYVFDPATFLNHEEPHLPGTPLPCSWQVTSDSISARIASVLNAEELVLLKSALPRQANDIQQLSADGYVDSFFKVAAATVRAIRFVNLREDGFPTRQVR